MAAANLVTEGVGQLVGIRRKLRATAKRPDNGKTHSGYEKDLFPRSASAASEADGNLKLCFDDNAPQSLLDLFTSYRSMK